MRHAPGDMQQTANDMQRATGNTRQTFKQHAADNDMQRNMQHATGKCNMQHKPWSLEKTIDNRQQGNRQHAADTGRRRQNQATHATDNVQRQQPTCKRTRHAGCHRKHTAPPYFEQRAAEKQQHARSIVLDNQCATRHRRHTQDATYDPCRSM
jgi:hypothetical protein